MKKLKVNYESRYLPVPATCQKFNICRGSVMRIAKECNAVIRIGKSVRIDTDLLEKHIQKTYRG